MAVQESELGKRIQQYRMNNKLTLRELADKAGLTKGYLSRIENSTKSPPVSTLLSVVGALNISISELFGENEKNGVTFSVVKPSERHMLAKDASTAGYAYESLAHNYPNRRMEPYIFTFPMRKKEKMFQHKGEEFVYVLEGKGRMFYGDNEYFLEEGDAIYFNGEIPHHGHAEGNKPWKCLVVLYTPV